MPRIVWWEIESPDPEAFQRFHAELWSWTFELGGDDRWFALALDPSGVSFGLWTDRGPGR
jgi:predicted enzyme related to lactoylglutathione lyase